MGISRSRIASGSGSYSVSACLSPSWPSGADAREIAQDLMAAYVDGEIDRVELVYNSYVSPLVQKVTHETLLPLQEATILEAEEDDEDEDGDTSAPEGHDGDKHALTE